MQPLTIIMPTYNGAKYLGTQIESILEQSDPNFKLVIVDDGSTDNSIEIVDSYVARDKRVERLASNGNLGQNRRLADLIRGVSTEFVAIADQDDIWDRDRNAILLDAIGTKALVFGRSQLVDASGKDLGMSILESLDIDPHTAGPLQSLFRPLVSAHAAIIRTDWLDLGALYGSMPFDRFLGLEAQFSRGIGYIDQAVVYHRIHDQNQCNGSVLQQSVRAPLVSRYYASRAATFIQCERVRLYSTFEQLGRSFAMPKAVSRKFKENAEICLKRWFAEGGRYGEQRASLESILHSTLDEYAGSRFDLEYFQRRVSSLTGSQFSPLNLKLAFKTYRAYPGDLYHSA